MRKTTWTNGLGERGATLDGVPLTATVEVATDGVPSHPSNVCSAVWRERTGAWSVGRCYAVPVTPEVVAFLDAACASV